MTATEISSLPFYWRMRSRLDEPNVAPDRLPFAFAERGDLGLLVQRPSAAVTDALDRVYRADANIGYLQDGNPLAAGYGRDLLAFVTRHLAGRKGVVAEIGCGGCYMLEALAQAGHRVVGIDPSPVAARAGATKGVAVVQTFFPNPDFTDRYDVILHMNVLEHVADPVGFLRAHLANLEPEGLVLVGVPDCTENIRRGDLSMAMHEHLSYFADRSLGAVAEAAGFRVVEIAPSGHGGSLYAALTPGAGRDHAPGPGSVLDAFGRRAEGVLGRLRDFASQPGSLGFYVPLRALPYIAALDLGTGIRLFDDAAHWHGCYFDGLDVPIENRADLLARPVDKLVIASLTFGRQIAAKLAGEVPPAMEVRLLGDFL